MSSARSSAAGIATGALVLAGIVGFGVGLPKVAADPVVALPTLPDEVGGLQAVATIDPEAVGFTDADARANFEQVAAGADENDAEAADALAEQYGAAAVRMYVDASALQEALSGGSIAQVTATVVPGEAGLLMTNGPYQAANYQLREIDGHHCAVLSRSGYSATGEESATYQVECRTSVDGVTYDVSTYGMAPEDASAALDDLVAGSGA
ncbi:hypothetical protein E8D34_01920 [Nocardioides sp. GY 10113]|uniref:hypothetical protein n=1 Tax=Nocardioides sp. GY 10113 TaxID=2569761 RepID=UPI0010A8D9FF|nr:hypothetical protein [Nocardioides sp. GY 10113]TIC89268.1 hypothetical protein E8D34_01920 [Nocardioides sp. GY 10113]